MKVFICPTDAQIQYLNSKFGEFFIFQKNKSFLNDNVKSISIDELKNNELIPCTEEAIYFISRLNKSDFKLPFKYEYLNHVTKIGASNSLDEHNISHIKKSTKIPIHYPFIAKPNFGFGSINVKKIQTKLDLKKYKTSFDDVINNSIVKKLQEKYLPDLKNSIIFEEDESDSDFYSVPFIFNKKSNTVTTFPILGLNKFLDNKLSNYYWSSFLFNPIQIKEDIKEKITKTLTKLAQTYCNVSMVCMAEVVYNRVEDEVKVVEFSPRTPGGKLAQVIKLSTGINLETLFLEIIINSKTIDSINTYNASPFYLKLSLNDSLFNADTSIESYSTVFESKLYYNIYDLNKHKLALIPGGFNPLHKGHEYIIDKTIFDGFMPIILVIDRETKEIPICERADWISDLYPQSIVIKLYNLPRNCKEIVQNLFIRDYLLGLKIDCVYHSNTENSSLAKVFNAKNVLVDPSRTIVPISATKIRNDLEANKQYLSEKIYKNYKKFLKNN